MAFLINNFSPLGSNSRRGNAPQHFSYITTDNISNIIGDDTYFLEIYSMLSVGDIVTTIVVNSISNPTALIEKNDLIIKSIDISSVVSRTSDFSLFSLNAYMPDVSTAGSVWAPSFLVGTAILAIGVLGGTIATADAAITVEIEGNLIGSATVTAAGSAAGDVIVAPLFGASTIISGAGQPVEIITDGASTNTVPIQWSIIVSPYYS